MKVQLTLQEKLKDLRVERNLTLMELSKEVGISASTLGTYENDEYKDISHSYLVILAKYYEVSADWLLGLSEVRNIANYEITELHLSDEILDFFKTHKVNNRLLEELFLHPKWVEVMVDMEIYVDGIASMQIENMNSWLDLIRSSLYSKIKGTDLDVYEEIFKVARINEDEYFLLRIHNKLDEILRAIRCGHEKDYETQWLKIDKVDAKKVKRLLMQIKLKGNPIEEFWNFFCNELQIDQSRLSEEQKESMKSVLRRSKLLKRIPSQKHK